MLRKYIAASVAALMLLALVPASMAQSTNTTSIQPYNGLVGSGSPIYIFKIYIEKLDVFLTLDSQAKLQKQMAYADERLAEAQAAAINNNSAAIDAALNEYENQMNEVNSTIDNGSTAIVMPEIDDDEQTLLDMINNSSMPDENKERLADLYNNNIDIKNGCPFIYYNNTSYFMPPGQMKKINSTHLPPGLAKKGYVKPVPTITNGSPVWPWDEMNYQYNQDNQADDQYNQTHSMNTTSKDKSHKNNGKNNNKNSHDNGNNDENDNQD